MKLCTLFIIYLPFLTQFNRAVFYPTVKTHVQLLIINKNFQKHKYKSELI